MSFSADAAKRPRSYGYDQLLASGAFSDFTIKCGDREWKVHKAIMCPQSEYFTAVCTGNFSEATSGMIDLTGDDEDALGALIRFFYTGEYPIARSYDDVQPHLSPSEPEMLEDPICVLNVHILADKYGIERLMTATADLFMRLVKKSKYSVAFGTWLVAVLELTSLQSVLRREMFELVLLFRRKLFDERRSDSELFDEGRSDSEPNVAALKAALIRCPGFAVELLAASSLEM